VTLTASTVCSPACGPRQDPPGECLQVATGDVLTFDTGQALGPESDAAPGTDDSDFPRRVELSGSKMRIELAWFRGRQALQLATQYGDDGASFLARVCAPDKLASPPPLTIRYRGHRVNAKITGGCFDGQCFGPRNPKGLPHAKSCTPVPKRGTRAIVVTTGAKTNANSLSWTPPDTAGIFRLAPHSEGGLGNGVHSFPGYDFRLWTPGLRHHKTSVLLAIRYGRGRMFYTLGFCPS
jgi:hypothetical protein